jgi:hypothetical protein
MGESFSLREKVARSFSYATLPATTGTCHTP